MMRAMASCWQRRSGSCVWCRAAVCAHDCRVPWPWAVTPRCWATTRRFAIVWRLGLALPCVRPSVRA
eukprot:4546839-Lingulodinium_polyedra.AAC.1